MQQYLFCQKSSCGWGQDTGEGYCFVFASLKGTQSNNPHQCPGLIPYTLRLTHFVIHIRTSNFWLLTESVLLHVAFSALTLMYVGWQEGRPGGFISPQRFSSRTDGVPEREPTARLREKQSLNSSSGTLCVVLYASSQCIEYVDTTCMHGQQPWGREGP